MGETEGRGEEKRLILTDLAFTGRRFGWTANLETVTADTRIFS